MVTNLEGLIRPVKLCIGFLKERRPEFQIRMLMRRKRVMMVTNLEGLIKPVKLGIGFLKDVQCILCIPEF